MARFSAYALLTVLAVVPFAVVARSVHAPSNANALYFSIQSNKAGTPKCADIDDNGNVVMTDCVAGSTSQLWTSEDTVIKHYSGQCMEVCVKNCHYRLMGRRRVWIKDCANKDAQKWITFEGSLIKSVQNGNCLDVCSSRTCSPRGDVITFECHGDPNQQWSLLLGGYTGPPPSREVREIVDFAADVREQ